MTKIEFLMSLHDKLSGLPRKEVKERLAFYSEMIEDRMEEGVPEEDAVAAVGSVDEIAELITAEIPLAKIAKEKIKPDRKLKTWEIVLLALGSPVWLSLLIAVVAVAFSVYAAVWAIIVSFWAVFAALIACAVYAMVAGAAVAIIKDALTGMALVGICLILAGCSIFLFFGCRAATDSAARLTKNTVLWMKKMLIKKEDGR